MVGLGSFSINSTTTESNVLIWVGAKKNRKRLPKKGQSRVKTHFKHVSFINLTKPGIICWVIFHWLPWFGQLPCSTMQFQKVVGHLDKAHYCQVVIVTISISQILISFVVTSCELKIFLPPNLFHSCTGVGQVKVQDPTPNGTTKSSTGPPVPRPLWPNWEHFPSTVHQSAALPWACHTGCRDVSVQTTRWNRWTTFFRRKERNETLAPKRRLSLLKNFFCFFQALCIYR